MDGVPVDSGKVDMREGEERGRRSILFQLGAFGAGLFVGQALVNVGDNTTACDGGLHEAIELLISADGEL